MSAGTWRKRNRRVPWVGVKTGAAPGKTAQRVPCEAAIRPRGLTPGHHGRRAPHAAGSVIYGRREREAAHASIDRGGIKKLWDIRAEYYSAIKKNDILPCQHRWT